MPLFFLISGYLFNEKNTVKQFAVKKIKTRYASWVDFVRIFILEKTGHFIWM